MHRFLKFDVMTFLNKMPSITCGRGAGDINNPLIFKEGAHVVLCFVGRRQTT